MTSTTSKPKPTVEYVTDDGREGKVVFSDGVSVYYSWGLAGSGGAYFNIRKTGADRTHRTAAKRHLRNTRDVVLMREV